MKIVSWNCNGAFRKKVDVLLSAIHADIYIIQECENPKQIDCESFTQVMNRFPYKKWVGENKGLAVFSTLSITFEEWDNHYLNYFIPFVINGNRCYAVWSMKPYVEGMVVYFSIYQNYYSLIQSLLEILIVMLFGTKSIRRGIIAH